MTKINLSAENAAFLERLVREGRFPSAQASLEHAIDLLRRDDLVNELDLGIQEADQGKFSDKTIGEIRAEARAAAKIAVV